MNTITESNLINNHMKQCKKCLEVKHISEFFRAKRNSDGYRHDCKECCKKYRNKDKKHITCKICNESKLEYFYYKNEDGEITNNICKQCFLDKFGRKQCSVCHEIMKLEKFHNSKYGRCMGEKSHRCMECNSKYNKYRRGMPKIEVSEKRCIHCNTVKPIEHFHKSSCHSDGHRSICKKCRSTKDRLYRNKREWEFVEYKSNDGCQICGDKRGWILSYHHIKPEEKSFELDIKHFFRDREAFEKEKLKTVCLCHNCHQYTHFWYNRLFVWKKLWINRRGLTQYTFVQYKGSEKCKICGEKRGEVLTYHHTDPTRKESKMSNNFYNLDRFEEEKKKCVCLCANCHHELHFCMHRLFEKKKYFLLLF
jgi:hypothetical protein